MKFFDATFFRFCFGFMAILALGFIALMIVGYSGEENIARPTTAVVESR